jgi:hypothetical protein
MRPPKRVLEIIRMPDNAWAPVKRLLARLTAAELEQAEALERLGKRRTNMMRLFRTERYQRVHHAERGLMLRLKVETNL